MRYIAGCVAMALTVCFIGCHRNQILVPVNDSADSPMIWRNKLDCDVFAQKTKGLELGVNMTFFGVMRVGPSVKISNSIKQKWNDNVSTVNVMYRGLCNDWNSGLCSSARFNRKRDEIDELYAVLAKNNEFRDSFNEYWKKQANEVFAELDKELHKKKERELQTWQTDMQGKFNNVDDAFKKQQAKMQEP